MVNELLPKIDHSCEKVIKRSIEKPKEELFTGDLSEIPNQLNQSYFLDIKGSK